LDTIIDVLLTHFFVVIVDSNILYMCGAFWIEYQERFCTKCLQHCSIVWRKCKIWTGNSYWSCSAKMGHSYSLHPPQLMLSYKLRMKMLTNTSIKHSTSSMGEVNFSSLIMKRKLSFCLTLSFFNTVVSN